MCCVTTWRSSEVWVGSCLETWPDCLAWPLMSLDPSSRIKDLLEKSNLEMGTRDHLKQKHKEGDCAHYSILSIAKWPPLNLTSVRIIGQGFILVNQCLDLILPETRKQFLIEPRVSLLLVEELGEILLRHGGFGGAGGRGTERQSHLGLALTSGCSVLPEYYYLCFWYSLLLAVWVWIHACVCATNLYNLWLHCCPSGQDTLLKQIFFMIKYE